MPKPTPKSTTASRESPPPAQTKDEEKIVRVLKNLLLAMSYSYRKAEVALGLSRGTLSRVFKGTRPLRFSHITGICRLAGLSPGGFFHLVYHSRSLLATYPDLPGDEPPPKSPVHTFDFLDPDLSELFRFDREEQEEVRELFRAVFSSVTTARWVLWWLEDEASRKNAWVALRTSLGLGRGGGCLDPNG
jgi:transcriptional regulator with XRE-family HTH domain